MAKKVTKFPPLFHTYGKLPPVFLYIWQRSCLHFIHIMAKKLPVFHTYGRFCYMTYTLFLSQAGYVTSPNSPPIFKWPESEHGRCHRVFSQPAPKMTRFKRSVGWRRAKHFSKSCARRNVCRCQVNFVTMTWSMWRWRTGLWMSP